MKTSKINGLEPTILYSLHNFVKFLPLGRPQDWRWVAKVDMGERVVVKSARILWMSFMDSP